jgi:hypothetical protein
MRQNSGSLGTLSRARDLKLNARSPACLVDRRGARPRRTRARGSPRLTGALANRAQRRHPPPPASPSPLAGAPPPRSGARHPQLIGAGRRGGQEHDLRAPPRAVLVALGHVRHDAGDLQVIEPALQAAAMRAHEPRSLSATARHSTPAHHRRHPRDQLLQRTREPPRARRVTEPKQVPLDRVRARLQPIVTRRRTPPRTPRATKQCAHDQPARLGRDRRARRSIPTTSRSTRRRCALQRHRQRPKAPSPHTTWRRRADARGATGPADRSRARRSTGARRCGPSARGWRSVRDAATVGLRIDEGAPRGAICRGGRAGRPGWHPVFRVPEAS